MSQFLVTVTPREPATRGERVHTLYLLAGPALTPTTVAQLVAGLLHDPVVQSAVWCPLTRTALAEAPAPAAANVVEVAYRPGVTDNEGESVLEGAHRLGLPGLVQARALRQHLLPAGVSPAARSAELAIDLVQTTLAYAAGQAADERLAFYTGLITAPDETTPHIAHVPLRAADDAGLLQISREGILALDLAEMRVVRDYFAALGRDPSDGELETLAQTWSEHCSHKTFKAKVRYRTDTGTRGEGDARTGRHGDRGTRGQEDTGTGGREDKGTGGHGESGNRGQGDDLYPMLHLLEQDEVELDSLIKTFLMVATEQVLAARDDEWVLSAFVDNAGILAFGAGHEVSFKVETHNHPSALEPFGGANTGLGGVIRDVLGVSAEPIANTDVLCFGLPNTAPEELPPGVLHPRRVATGVVAGIRDYGNKLGIPTVNGAVLFDPGYAANPLVYAGTVGIAPRGMHPRNVQPGDAVVVLGGRTGRDGIHGATFSSIELTHDTATTVGSAVQIGDPITEKKLLDVLLQARDQRLYSAITDCGAGGLSSAVGEMGAECGVTVELERVPRKYAGLQPWEVWLSEAQERMVLAVPPANLAAFLALCAAEDVEATVIGSFAGDGHLRVTHAGQTVVDMTMAFLHDGRPQRVLEAVWEGTGGQGDRGTGDRGTGGHGDTGTRGHGDTGTGGHGDTGTRGHGDVNEAPHVPLSPAPLVPASLLLALLAHPNIASKERIVRTYDHEVRGATVIKPLVGAQMDGPGDAAVLRPLPDTLEGLALGNGVNPRYGRIDPYWMALAVVDEALRNVVAVGGDPSRTAILDNFCWGDPRQPDRMAGLVRAAAGCYDAAVAFGTPFISGKDSLNNEYRDATGTRVAIPPTLLISALSHVPDVRRCVTMDLKEAANALYLVGSTRDEFGGSHFELVAGGGNGHQAAYHEAHEAHEGQTAFAASATVPKVDLAAARTTFAALHGAIGASLVRACHDLSEGGLAVAAAEMVIAGDLGLSLNLALVPGAAAAPSYVGEQARQVLNHEAHEGHEGRTASATQLDEAFQNAVRVALFSETPSRFLVEVRPADVAAFEAALAGVTLARLGSVTATPVLHLTHDAQTLIELDADSLRQRWKSGLDGIDL